MDELTQQDFVLIRDLIYQHCGIVIKEDKKYLIIQRLGPIAEKAGCRSYNELYRKLKFLESDEAFRHKVIEAITTNETFFFRDQHPFDAFKHHILPDIVALYCKARQEGRVSTPKVRIWSAAASTGQEAYSLAMLIQEYISSSSNKNMLTSNEFRILATDISNEVLSKAMNGKYTQMEIGRGLIPELRDKYFHKKGDHWQITDKIREMVEFRQVNLIKPFMTVGNFELIFCRNVLIYFDDETKMRILNQFYDMLVKGGYLFLGAMENTYCLTDKFKSERFDKTIVYKKL